MKGYIPRNIESVVRRAVAEFPVLVLTGPRQSGKTTLLKRMFGHDYAYVSLEPPDVRQAAAADPRGFLAMCPAPVIFDEVQYAPELFSYIKEQVDADRDHAGRYLLTGSQNLLLTQQISESLAGRAAMLTLLPLSLSELKQTGHVRFPWEGASAGHASESFMGNELWRNVLRGGYPELAASPERDVSLWFSAYVQTYLERDVRNLRQIGDLTQFQTFLRALAARNAQLLNLSDLARDLGIAVNTIKAWISVLEATYQIFILHPYHANVGKRLVKRPKIYFMDTGILCYLVGLRDPLHAAAGPMGGALMENVVLAEIVKHYMHRGERPPVWFWRTAAGCEVDIIIESDGRLHPVEIKLSSTPKPAYARGIHEFSELFGALVAPGYVIHPGDVRLPLGGGVTALPLADLVR